jgi:outer membrane protein assembly factor BamD (BamD/ComL family)
MRERKRFWTVIIAVCCAKLASAQGPPSDLARQHLESGIQFYEQERYKQALNDFQIIVTSMSNTEYADDALLRIGRYYLEVEQDFDKAKESFDGVLRGYPTGDAAPGAYYYLGETLFRGDRTGRAIDDALANYQRVFLYPGNPWIPAALNATGKALERQGKFQEAVDAYFQVIVDYPKSDWSADAQLGVGRSFVRSGQPLEAMAQFQEVRNGHPDSPEAESALDWLTLLYRFYGAPMMGQSITYHRDPSFKAVLKDDFKDVKALRVSSSGIHLLERGRKRVVTFDYNGQFAGSKGVGDPYGLFVDARNELVIANEKGVNVGDHPRVFTVPAEDGPEQLEKIRWAACDRLGEIFVYDDDEKKVLRYDPGGQLLGAFPDSTPRKIRTIEIDGAGNIIFLDDDRNVSVYTPEGQLVSRIQTKRGQLNMDKATDIATDPAGYLYILDEDEASIAVFDASFQLVAQLKSPSLGQGTLEKPTFLDVDASGDLYVYDEDEKAIIRLR